MSLSQENISSNSQSCSTTNDEQDLFEQSELPNRVWTHPPYDYQEISTIDMATGESTVYYAPALDGKLTEVTPIDALSHISSYPNDICMQLYFKNKYRSFYSEHIMQMSLSHNDDPSLQTNLDKIFHIYQETRSNFLYSIMTGVTQNHEDLSIREIASDLIQDHYDSPLTKLQDIHYPAHTWDTMKDYGLILGTHYLAFNEIQQNLESPYSVKKLGKRVKECLSDYYMDRRAPSVHIKTIIDKPKVEHAQSEPDHINGTGLRTYTTREAFDILCKNDFASNVIESTTINNNDDLPLFSSITGRFTFNLLRPIGADVCAHIKSSLTSYGKGTTKTNALISSTMEFIERHSALWCHSYYDYRIHKEDLIAFGLDSFAEKDKFVIVGSHEELSSEFSLLDPNLLNIPRFLGKVDYTKEKLHWTNAATFNGNAEIDGKTILVPANHAFFHALFPEIDLGVYDSTGLASGMTMNEAKRQGLLEIFERNAISSSFFDEEKCFVLNPNEYPLNAILSSKLKEKVSPDFNIQFFDMTQKFGVPAYTAFVRFEDQLITGNGADLNASIAINRALGELLPNINVHLTLKPNSRFCPPARNIKTHSISSLPNFSTNSVEKDVALLEELLRINGYIAYYADLTNEGIEIPVVRCLVPGLDVPKRVTRQQIENILPTTK